MAMDTFFTYQYDLKYIHILYKYSRCMTSITNIFMYVYITFIILKERYSTNTHTKKKKQLTKYIKNMKLYNFQRKIVLLFIFIFINTINVNAWGSMFSSEEENSDKKTNENAPLDTENVLSSTEITERVAEENNAPKKEVEDHVEAFKYWEK